MRLSPFSIIITFAALALIGLAFLPRLGIQLHPSAVLPAMRISYSWSEAPAISMEREVTSKLEAAMSTMRGIEEVSSVSSKGRGYIDITLKKGTNTELARFEIASHVRRLYPSFPEGVSYPNITMTRAAGRTNPLLTYTIVAPEASHTISDYVENYLLPPLSQVKGLDEVSFYGANPLEYRVVYNIREMEQWGVSVSDIVMALENHFGEQFLGMGVVQRDESQQEVRQPVILTTTGQGSAEWSRIPVATVNERIVYLSDVASWQLVEKEPQRYYRINGRNTLLMTLTAARGENQIRLAASVKDHMAQLQQQMPPGWQAILTYDDTDFIRKDLRRVTLRMLFSFSILLLFVLLVSRSTRYLLLILLTVVANLSLALVWYYFLEIEIHLYSLAGITVSFGIIIDNSIVMIEHLRNHGNKKVFLAILAATLTTMGSLSVIFLLGEQQQAQLKDFAAVVLVNLMLSLLIAWFFIPAVYTKVRMKDMKQRVFSAAARRRVRYGLMYHRMLSFLKRHRRLVLLAMLLIFGLPVHLLPSKLEGEGTGALVYNKTLGSSFYQQRVKRVAEKALGGTFRLFSKFVYERSFFSDPERTTLYARGRMPDGATIHQLNESMILMEAFLTEFPQVDQFQTNVYSADNGYITVTFHPQYDNGSFPQYMQNMIIQKALAIGGAEWEVYGVGQGFSNVLRSSSASAQITLEGYNYDHLYRHAQTLMELAQKNQRVANPAIYGSNPWRSPNRMEFLMRFDPALLALNDLSLYQVYRHLNDKLMQRPMRPVMVASKPVEMRLEPAGYLQYSVWDMENLPLHTADRMVKTSGMMQIEKRAMGNDIYKNNQQYHLVVGFDFQGPHVLQERVVKQLVEDINAIMPLGYEAKVQSYSWRDEEKKQHLLILLVIVIIYFICAILLESLLQPLAIIGLIPISFAGLFLTFYLFELNFDQGGWAAFILLSGLAVNAGLYILNDYNGFRKDFPGRDATSIYLKAYQYKILPVLLTIFSTIIGLVPFLVGQQEAFWFAFAAGTTGGLVFSLVGLLVFFPVFLRK